MRRFVQKFINNIDIEPKIGNRSFAGKKVSIDRAGVKIEDHFRQLIRKQVEYKVLHFSNDCCVCLIN